MLYLMLIVVFSKLSKKWWFFLILGWGQCYVYQMPLIFTASFGLCMQSISYCCYNLVPALVPVVVGLAARHMDYGVENENGELE